MAFTNICIYLKKKYSQSIKINNYSLLLPQLLRLVSDDVKTMVKFTTEKE